MCHHWIRLCPYHRGYGKFHPPFHDRAIKWRYLFSLYQMGQTHPYLHHSHATRDTPMMIQLGRSHHQIRHWPYLLQIQRAKHLIDTNNEKIILGVTSNGVSKEVVIIRDLQDFDIVFEFPRHNVSIDSYAFSECKAFFATGYMNGDIKVWSLTEKKELFKLSNRSNSIQKIYWKKNQFKNSRISEYLLYTDDTYLFLWDFSKKKICQKYEVSSINDIAFFEGNTKFVTASPSGDIVIWSIYNQKELFKCNIGRGITKIEIDEEEKMLILGEHNGQIHFLKIQNEPNKTK